MMAAMAWGTFRGEVGGRHTVAKNLVMPGSVTTLGAIELGVLMGAWSLPEILRS
jgi:hypothetical protein